jgi:hypothetical protein
VPSSTGSAASSLRETMGDTSSISPSIKAVEENLLHEVVTHGIRANPCAADASTIRRACRYDCYCVCHTASTAILPKGISKLSGNKIQCNEPSCEGARSSEDKAVNASFFRRAISEVMSSKSTKVCYHLSTYRMVSEGSDANRYVKHGNLEKLKLCIQTGEATVWDTAPDGWSLLHVSSIYVESSEKLISP